MASRKRPNRGFAYAARARLDQAPVRAVMAALTGLVMSNIVGLDFAMTWMVAYASAQGLEFWSLSPLVREKRETLPKWRMTLGAAGAALTGVVYGGLSIPLWLQGGPLGGVCAAIVLSAALINGVVHTPGSRVMLTCVLGPHIAYLAALPWFMNYYGGDSAYTSAAVLGAIVFIAHGLMLWRALEATRESEANARFESEAKAAEVAEAMAAKSEFVASVSHDLRTPISAMLAGAAELEKSAKDAASRSHAQLIGDAGRMMKSLLDDILDHAKLEAGRMTVETTTFDMRDLLAQVARFWAQEARKKGLKLRFEGAAHVPQWLQGDPTRLRQVLNNLISNAIKFTESGSVTLKLAAWPAEDDGCSIRFQIIDTGPGMSREQTTRLFRAYDQTGDDVARKFGGSGLGLAISRKLSRLMGGHLTALSVVGEGSVFTLGLVFPLGEAPEHAAPPQRTLQEIAAEVAHSAEASGDEEGDERPLRVLVVDDHEINRRAVQLILEPLGCLIATASHGKMALAMAAAEAYDVILMDVRMPEMDGRETTRRLRAAEGPNQHVPVIAVTADNGEDDVAACMNAGMTHFVGKPIDPQTLLDTLADALGGYEEPADEAAEPGRDVA
jgi:signal transduction histidine kinase/CheY-like chemotaxis protein